MKIELTAWERYFVLLALHLLWNQFKDPSNPHDDDISNLIAKFEETQ